MQDEATLLPRRRCSPTTSSVPFTRLTHISKLLNARTPVTPAALPDYWSRKGVMTPLRTIQEPDAALLKLSTGSLPSSPYQENWRSETTDHHSRQLPDYLSAFTPVLAHLR